MNKYEKAAEFGARMGKIAADSVAAAPKGNSMLPVSAGPFGGPSNKVGTLPSASTTPRVPAIGSQKLYIPKRAYTPPSGNTIGGGNPSGMPKVPVQNQGVSVQDSRYANFINTNYSKIGDPNNPNASVVPGAGTSRQQFHTDLSNQLEGQGAYNAWSKRVGQLADVNSAEAPISHYSLKSPADFSNWGPATRAPEIAASPAHAAAKLPGNFVDDKNTAPVGQYAYVNQNPSLSNRLADWAIGMPKTLRDLNLTRLHETTHAGSQDLSAGTEFTDSRGLPLPSSPVGTAPMNNRQLASTVPAEAGAVFNEMAQGARAYNDVTGKHMEGNYNFSPEVSMSNRDMAAMAKKYKPADLNSPAGQLFLRRILETSK